MYIQYRLFSERSLWRFLEINKNDNYILVSDLKNILCKQSNINYNNKIDICFSIYKEGDSFEEDDSNNNNNNNINKNIGNEKDNLSDQGNKKNLLYYNKSGYENINNNINDNTYNNKENNINFLNNDDKIYNGTKILIHRQVKKKNNITDVITHKAKKEIIINTEEKQKINIPPEFLCKLCNYLLLESYIIVCNNNCGYSVCRSCLLFYILNCFIKENEKKMNYIDMNMLNTDNIIKCPICQGVLKYGILNKKMELTIKKFVEERKDIHSYNLSMEERNNRYLKILDRLNIENIEDLCIDRKNKKNLFDNHIFKHIEKKYIHSHITQDNKNILDKNEEPKIINHFLYLIDNYKLNCIKEYGMLYVDFNNYLFDSIQKIKVKSIYEQQINDNKDNTSVNINIHDDCDKNMNLSLRKDNMTEQVDESANNVDDISGVDHIKRELIQEGVMKVKTEEYGESNVKGVTNDPFNCLSMLKNMSSYLTGMVGDDKCDDKGDNMVRIKKEERKDMNNINNVNNINDDNNDIDKENDCVDDFKEDMYNQTKTYIIPISFVGGETSYSLIGIYAVKDLYMRIDGKKNEGSSNNLTSTSSSLFNKGNNNNVDDSFVETFLKKWFHYENQNEKKVGNIFEKLKSGNIYNIECINKYEKTCFFPARKQPIYTIINTKRQKTKKKTNIEISLDFKKFKDIVLSVDNYIKYGSRPTNYEPRKEKIQGTNISLSNNNINNNNMEMNENDNEGKEQEINNRDNIFNEEKDTLHNILDLQNEQDDILTCSINLQHEFKDIYQTLYDTSIIPISINNNFNVNNPYANYCALLPFLTKKDFYLFRKLQRIYKEKYLKKLYKHVKQNNLNMNIFFNAINALYFATIRKD
ncbi:conserved Plasmodium protein, unknown function [Plasmodium sp. DRC-Itaito]|nr:conserved Plasmodium protein, unknown function [Plasmodium sp. DRC-Itaito]